MDELKKDASHLSAKWYEDGEYFTVLTEKYFLYFTAMGELLSKKSGKWYQSKATRYFVTDEDENGYYAVCDLNHVFVKVDKNELKKAV